MDASQLIQAYPPLLGGLAAWALLGLQLIWSAELLVYGLPMIKHPRHWMDHLDGGSKFPTPLQIIGAITIFGGGFSILTGLFTPIAAFGLAGAMIIALGLHLKNGIPFAKPRPDAAGESYDVSLLYLAIALLLLVLGPGKFSLDHCYLVNRAYWSVCSNFNEDRTRLGSLSEPRHMAHDLMIAVSKLLFAPNGTINRHALYDTDATLYSLSIQAMDLDLFVHQTSRFNVEKARSRFQIPPQHESVTTGNWYTPVQFPELIKTCS